MALTLYLIFRDYASSKLALDLFAPVTPLRHRLIYNMTSPDFEPWVFAAEVAGKPITLVTRCVWGGPQTAILVEELAALGVQTIVGYGVAGSLDPGIQQGAFVVAESALPTDGTTKAYDPDSVQIGDPDLLSAVTVAGQEFGVPVQPVTAVVRTTKWSGRGRPRRSRRTLRGGIGMRHERSWRT